MEARSHRAAQRVDKRVDPCPRIARRREDGADPAFQKLQNAIRPGAPDYNPPRKKNDRLTESAFGRSGRVHASAPPRLKRGAKASRAWARERAEWETRAAVHHLTNPGNRLNE